MLACQTSPKTSVQKPSAQIVVLSALQSEIAPCGCTSHPLGGLDRIAAHIARLRAQAPTILVVLGPLWTPKHPIPKQNKPQHEAQIHAIGQIIDRLAPDVLYLPQDEHAHTLPYPTLRAALGKSLAAAKQQQPQAVQVGPWHIGFAAASFWRDQASPKRLRTPTNIDGLVYLPQAFLQPSAAIPSINLFSSSIAEFVVQGAEPRPPKAISRSQANKSLWTIDAGSDGQYLGVMQLWGEPKPQMRKTWHYDDQGARAAANKKAQIERLIEAIARLPAGKAQDARRQKLKTLRQQPPAQKSPSTTHAADAGFRFTYRALPIEADDPSAAWAQEILATTDKSLCTLSLKATQDRTCPPGPSKARYAGTQTCRPCHQDAFEVYQKTAHAHAWQTLTRQNKDCDLNCIGCHSVGYEQPGGYCRLIDVALYTDVGCESCHGPAYAHSQNPAKALPQGTPNRQACMQCHVPDHSDRFEFVGYRARILGPGHGAPKISQ